MIKEILTHCEQTGQTVYRLVGESIKQVIDNIRFEDPWYYDELIKGTFYIEANTQLLCIRKYIRDVEETRELRVVPFVLRGKIMDYYHHNIQSHHLYYTEAYNKIIKYYFVYMHRHT